nr:site-specific integrase [Acutalibacter muris]
MTTGKKRANGEGSLRKRSDGRWEGRYTAGRDPVTGKAIYKNVLAKTQKECKEKLAQAIEKNGKVDVVRSGKYTVAEWVRLWFETYSKPSIREQTAYYYNNYIEKHIVPGIGSIRLDKLTTIQIQQFYNKLKTSGRVQRYAHIELKDKGLSNRFIHGIHGVLRSALDQAVKERLITSNPAEGCKLPKIEKKEMKVLLPEQIGAYLQEANRRGFLPAYYLELTSGLRRGELLALLWTDLDVENMTISVTKQVNRINGELKVSQPKTSNSIRTIPIPKQAVDLLILEHEKHPDNPYMFPSPKTGTMYDPDSFRHTHEKILAAAGIEHIRFHDLRHTFATLSLQHGVDVKTLSNTLGHYSAGFTLDTYTHATQRMKREAAETIGSVIDQAM